MTKNPTPRAPITGDRLARLIAGLTPEHKITVRSSDAPEGSEVEMDLFLDSQGDLRLTATGTNIRLSWGQPGSVIRNSFLLIFASTCDPDRVDVASLPVGTVVGAPAYPSAFTGFAIRSDADNEPWWDAWVSAWRTDEHIQSVIDSGAWVVIARPDVAVSPGEEADR